MNPGARRGWQPPPAFAHRGEHGFGFRVIGDLPRVGAREKELRHALRTIDHAINDYVTNARIRKAAPYVTR